MPAGMLAAGTIGPEGFPRKHLVPGIPPPRGLGCRRCCGRKSGTRRGVSAKWLAREMRFGPGPAGAAGDGQRTRDARPIGRRFLEHSSALRRRWHRDGQRRGGGRGSRRHGGLRFSRWDWRGRRCAAGRNGLRGRVQGIGRTGRALLRPRPPTGAVIAEAQRRPVIVETDGAGRLSPRSDISPATAAGGRHQKPANPNQRKKSALGEAALRVSDATHGRVPHRSVPGSCGRFARNIALLCLLP